MQPAVGARVHIDASRGLLLGAKLSTAPVPMTGRTEVRRRTAGALDASLSCRRAAGNTLPPRRTGRSSQRHGSQSAAVDPLKPRVDTVAGEACLPALLYVISAGNLWQLWRLDNAPVQLSYNTVRALQDLLSLAASFYFLSHLLSPALPYCFSLRDSGCLYSFFAMLQSYTKLGAVAAAVAALSSLPQLVSADGADAVYAFNQQPNTTCESHSQSLSVSRASDLSKANAHRRWRLARREKAVLTKTLLRVGRAT